jgi:hypothetical protein
MQRAHRRTANEHQCEFAPCHPCLRQCSSGTAARYYTRAIRDAATAIQSLAGPLKVDVTAGGIHSGAEVGRAFADFAAKRRGVYCGRILKGERAANLPVCSRQNLHSPLLKAAKSLDLNIPPALLTGADEVID